MKNAVSSKRKVLKADYFQVVQLLIFLFMLMFMFPFVNSDRSQAFFLYHPHKAPDLGLSWMGDKNCHWEFERQLTN